MAEAGYALGTSIQSQWVSAVPVVMVIRRNVSCQNSDYDDDDDS